MTPTPEVYIFDMDHTLIDADCDVTWIDYTIAAGIAAADAQERAAYFFEEYNKGTLDIEEFLAFQLRDFIGHTPEEMAEHSRRHFERFIRAHIYAEAKTLIDSLKSSGVPLAILSSTNNVLVRPVADYFGITEVMGTTLELRDGRYTGGIVGEYGAQSGKIAPARAFAARHGATLAQTAYYGDSINDRNILEAVGFPCATNPSEALRTLAVEKNWRILSFQK